MGGEPLQEMTAAQLYAAGYVDLVSVVPPDGELTAGSRIRPEDRGKAPGVRNAEGRWHGYDWRKCRVTPALAAVWDASGGNIGLRASTFPALDVDVEDVALARVVLQFARRILGSGPERTSRPPRRLLVYRTDAPFSRIAAAITFRGRTHLVEMLGDGQQYLVAGKHPSGVSYGWAERPLHLWAPQDLTTVDRDRVLRFFHELAEFLRGRKIDVELLGSGVRQDAPPPNQEALRAPSLDRLADVVSAMPNPAHYGWHEFVETAYAIHAAGAEDLERAREIFEGWAARWENPDKSPDPDQTAHVWESVRPPCRVGWTWLLEQAEALTGRAVLAAAEEFDADPEAEPPADDTESHVSREIETSEPDLIESTDAWAAARVSRAVEDRVRYVPETGRWHVWNGVAWSVDRTNHARYLIWQRLLALSARLSERAAMAPAAVESKAIARTAAKLQAHSTLTSVTALLQIHPSLTAHTDVFDRDPWALNTPGGIVDLRTGTIRPCDPAEMHSRCTAVAPACGPAPRWEAFLRETTSGDEEMERFLQAFAGYVLTGTTVEQTLLFVWGPGKNGKTVFAETLAGVLGDYAQRAALDTFAATKGDRHPTDLAGLLGARLVISEETQAGRRWDEQRIKALTGGGKIRARFMRQDFFEFTPTFKIVVVGNHAPGIANVDEAMRRRLLIAPFTHQPPVRDVTLQDTLREQEWPQILQWMINGCLRWQREGLKIPERIERFTQEYIADEDLVSQWLAECCAFEEGAEVSRADLYRSWQQWCYRRGEDPGGIKSLKRKLDPKKAEYRFFDRKVDAPGGRINGYRGIRLVDELEATLI